VLVGRFDATPEDVEAIVGCGMIQGEQVGLSEMEGLADVEKVKKCYKISPEELKVGSLVDNIMCRVASGGMG